MAQKTSMLAYILAIFGIILIITSAIIWFLIPVMLIIGIPVWAVTGPITGLAILYLASIIISALWFFIRKRTEAKPAPRPALEEIKIQTIEPVAGPEEFIPAVTLPSPGKKQLPIETIEGIGKAYGDKMRKGGIDYVEDLALADPGKVAKLGDVSELVAKKWIAMARLTWLDDVSEEDAETIVLGANITSIEQLAVADPNDLYNKVSTAEKIGRVQVPKGYKITKSKVKKWIASAQKEMPE